MLSFGNIYDLAGYAVTKFGIRGIDWTSLAKKGRASVWDRNYIDEYMSPAWANMNIVALGLDLNPSMTQEEMQQAYSATAAALNEAAGSVSRLFGMPILEGQLTLTATREAVRKVISMCVQSSTYALALHLDETIHHSDLSDSEIMTHANLCVGVMNSIIALDKLGFFSALGLKLQQAPTAQSGLGIAPALIIAGVAIVCILAYAVVQYKSLSEVNQQIAHMCDNAQAGGDTALAQQCVQALAHQADAGAPVTLLKEIMKAVLPYAFAGGVIYVGILFAPGIVAKIMAPKKAA